MNVEILSVYSVLQPVAYGRTYFLLSSLQCSFTWFIFYSGRVTSNFFSQNDHWPYKVLLTQFNHNIRIIKSLNYGSIIVKEDLSIYTAEFTHGFFLKYVIFLTSSGLSLQSLPARTTNLRAQEHACDGRPLSYARIFSRKGLYGETQIAETLTKYILFQTCNCINHTSGDSNCY